MIHRSYIMPNGKRVAIGPITSSYAGPWDKPWGTCIWDGTKCRPLRRKALPARATLDEAQADLDAYAAKRGWEALE